MSEVKKDKPKHLGRGLQALLNPVVLENMAQKIQAGSAQKGPVMSEKTAVDGPKSAGVLAENASEKMIEAAQNSSQISENAAASASRQGDAPGASDAPKLPPDKDLRDSLSQVDISLISANPYQPRTEWDQAQLNELAESIRANGIVQPIIIRPVGSKYELIAGERRFRAAQLVGMKSVPAVVRQASDSQMLELALIENIHRADLNPIERAKAYQRYVQTFSLTQVEAAQRLGEDRSVVSNYLRLLDLPEDIKKMLSAGQLSMGHARAILGLPTDELRRKLANRALAGRLSVREVERLVKKYSAQPGENKANIQIKAPNIIDLENRLRREMGTKVAIDTKKNGQRGRIIIEFYSLDEFERITQKMGIESLEEV